MNKQKKSLQKSNFLEKFEGISQINNPRLIKFGTDFPFCLFMSIAFFIYNFDAVITTYLALSRPIM